MRAPAAKVKAPSPTVHKRIGRAGQLVLVRELPHGHVRDPQYEGKVVLERCAFGRTGSAMLVRPAGYGDTIEEAVDAACEVGG